jgi:O-antigen/teichoic acid export membrane protein
MEKQLKECLVPSYNMKFLKQVSLYTLVGIIGAGINFFIMPLLTHYLSPADYGLLAICNTYVTILLPVVSISAYALLSVEYFNQKSKEVYASQFSSIQLIPLFNITLLAVLVWAFYGRFADDLELGGTGVKWGFIILALTLFNVYGEQFGQYLILQKKAGKFAFYFLLRVVIEVSLTVYFIVYNRWGWQGRIYSWLITSAVFFAIGFVYFYKQGLIRTTVHVKHIREGIVFGSPLVLHGVGKFVINQSDRLFIAKMISLDAAGIYNIGYTIGSLVMIAVNAYFNFYSPFLMERLADITEHRRLQIVKMGYYYVFGCVVLLCLIALCTPFFFRWFIDNRYLDGVGYVFWVALGYCFWGGYMLFSGFIFYLRKSGILGWLAVFNVVTNLVFNYFFIQLFGAIGAAYATALSFFLLMMLVAVIAHKLLPMPWRNVRAASAVGLS